MLRRRLMKSGVDYSQMYLTFKVTGKYDGTFEATEETQYSLDGGATWVNLSADSSSPTISSGSKIMFKATSTQITFTGTAEHDVMGNPYSVIYGDNFKGVTSLSSEYALSNLFYNNKNLANAKNLSLPATTLAQHCYDSMFAGCTSLTTAPELPATTLAQHCYDSMFYGCTSLTTAPELPATTLASGCYISMFQDCTRLTTAPELPATTLADTCYYYMFEGCTRLTTAPELPATTLASGCYYYMFGDCTSLTTAPSVLPATTLTTTCYGYMFYGCTSLTTAPELPATRLTTNCYMLMFYGCTSLNYIKAMFTTSPITAYTNYWVGGVASSGTFVKNAAAAWTATGVNAVPSGWTVQTASS